MIGVGRERFFNTLVEIFKEELKSYKSYIDFLTPYDLEEDEADWFNIFSFRDTLAGLLFVSPLFPMAKELSKEGLYHNLVSLLRKADIGLSRKATLLSKYFDFSHWREQFSFELPRFAWWYYLDEVAEGKIKIPPEVVHPVKLYGLFVKGKYDGKECQVLLIFPKIPSLLKKKKNYVRNFFVRFQSNAFIDLPQLFIENNDMTLLLPSSAFSGKVLYRGTIDFRLKTYLAVPRKNSYFLNGFYEEFKEKIESGDKRIFTDRTLSQKEFAFFPVMRVRKKTIKVDLTMKRDVHKFDEQFTEMATYYSSIPKEVALVD